MPTGTVDFKQDAVKELMDKMAEAVSKSKMEQDYLKTANVNDLSNPGDILTREINRMTDTVREQSFPEEFKAAKLASEKKVAAPKAEDEKQAEIEREVVEEGVTTELKEASLADDENPHYTFRKGAEELQNPFFAKGKEDYLKETEPLWKQGILTIFQNAA